MRQFGERHGSPGQASRAAWAELARPCHSKGGPRETHETSSEIAHCRQPGDGVPGACTGVVAYSGSYGLENVIARRDLLIWGATKTDDERLSPSIQLALQPHPPEAKAGPFSWQRLDQGFEVGEMPVVAAGAEVDRILLAGDSSSAQLQRSRSVQPAERRPSNSLRLDLKETRVVLRHQRQLLRRAAGQAGPRYLVGGTRPFAGASRVRGHAPRPIVALGLRCSGFRRSRQAAVAHQRRCRTPISGIVSYPAYSIGATTTA